MNLLSNPRRDLLKVFYTNARSLIGKLSELKSLLKVNNSDIIVITETWANCHRINFKHEYHIDGFTLYHNDILSFRSYCRGNYSKEH